MAERGSVLRLKRRLGFAVKGEAEAVVVVQSGSLVALPTVLVVPLDPATSVFENVPVAVPVSAGEAGSTVSHVAIVTHVYPVRLDHLAPGIVGRLQPGTLARLDRVLRLVFGL